MADSTNTTDARRSEAGEVSLYTPVRIVLENRYLVITVTIGIFLLAVVPPLFGRRVYTSAAAFMPQWNAGAAGGLAAVAGQLGFNIRQGEPTQSPLFYAEIAESPELLGRLLADTFTVVADEVTEGDPISGTLAEFLKIDERDPERRRELAMRRLSDRIVAETTPMGLVRIQVTTAWPSLSQAIASRLIELINEFNLQTRQTNAAAETRFVQERLAEAEQELRRSEGELRSFLEANRQFETSPQLLFEYDRLQRQVTHQQQLYTGLRESYENARIAEVRDTPLITVVEPPRSPVYPDSRRIPLRGALGLLVGGMLGVLLASVRASLVRGPRGDPEYEMLQSAWNDTLADLRLARRRDPAGAAAFTFPEGPTPDEGRNAPEAT